MKVLKNTNMGQNGELGIFQNDLFSFGTNLELEYEPHNIFFQGLIFISSYQHLIPNLPCFICGLEVIFLYR